MATAAPSRPAAPAPKKLRHTFWWYMSCVFYTLGVLVLIVTCSIAGMGYQLYQDLEKVTPDIRVLLDHNKVEATQVFAADGSQLAEFKLEDRRWVDIESLKRDPSNPRNPGGRLIDATKSIEDARFDEHVGMDPKRILGALLANYRHGGISQGGSTITEQLVKLVYLTRARTVSRRLSTAMIALQLERRLTKDEILEAYLNEIYYGNGAHGCEAAARRYFGVGAADLTIAQAALLAGLPQSPSRLDPFDHLDRAIKRQHVVLHEMFENHRINYGQYRAALADTSVVDDIQSAARKYTKPKKSRWRYPYFVSYVRSYLKKQYQWTDDEIDRSGRKIYTTLDPKLQDMAERAVKNQLNRLGRPGLEGALVCIDPWSGRVLAMVGGRNYYDDAHNGQWNRAVQGKRQVGSTMKPYIYAAAMEAGMTPDTTMVDSTLWVCGTKECPPEKRSTKRGGHEVRNYDRKHHGAMPLRKAIGMSNNVIATRLLLKVGIQNAIQQAHLMGVQSPLTPYPSLALGVSDLSLLEHVSAYGVFATKGLRAESTPIIRIETPTGETMVEQPTPVHAARVLTPGAAKSMWDMLRYVVTSGTGKAASIPGVDVIGKTGTTSSNKDVWFMGATPDLVAGVWMGFDQPRELFGSAGGKWCAPVWRTFMQGALQEWKLRQPVKKMIEDARATAQRKLIANQFKQFVSVRICDDSGMLATRECPHTHMEQYSAASGAPTDFCDIHKGAASPDNVNTAPAGAPAPPANAGGGDDLQSPPADEAEEKPVRRNNKPAPDLNAPARRQYYKDNKKEEEGGDGGNEGIILNEDPNADAAAAQGEAPARRGTTAVGGAAKEITLTVCADSGELPGPNCPVRVQQTFEAGKQPRQVCRLHR